MICTGCEKTVYIYHMCEETNGEWCNTCFEEIECERKHGEGCATHVFEGRDVTEEEDLEALCKPGGIIPLGKKDV